MQTLISDFEGLVWIEYSGAPEYTATRSKFLDLGHLWIRRPQSANNAMYTARAPACICTERTPRVKGDIADDAQDECGAQVGVGDIA